MGVRFLTIKIKRYLSFIMAVVLVFSTFIPISLTANAYSYYWLSYYDNQIYGDYWNSVYYAADDQKSCINNVPVSSSIIRFDNLPNSRTSKVTVSYKSDDNTGVCVMIGKKSENPQKENTDELETKYAGLNGINRSSADADGYRQLNITLPIGYNYLILVPINRNLETYTSWQNDHYGDDLIDTSFSNGVSPTGHVSEPYNYFLGDVISKGGNIEYKIEFASGARVCDTVTQIENKYNNSNATNNMSVTDGELLISHTYLDCSDVNKSDRKYGSMQYGICTMSDPQTYEPIYADDKTGLPNGGIMVDLSGNKTNSEPAYLEIKFNPNGDKTLNSQKDTYNDSAVILSAEVGHVDADGKFIEVDEYESDTNAKYAVEAYPDSNQVSRILSIPVLDSELKNYVVIRVYPGGYIHDLRKNADSLSDRYNFSYEISLKDALGREIVSYIKDSGKSTTVEKNYIAGGILSNTDNPLDTYKLSLSEATGTKPSVSSSGEVSGGYLRFDFIDVPVDFDYSDIDISLSLAENSQPGSSAFGYSKFKKESDMGGYDDNYTGLSNYLGGPVLDYTLYYTKISNNHGWFESDDFQPRIGYGNDKSASIMFYKTERSYDSKFERRKLSKDDYDTFLVVPNNSQYKFNYTIKSVNQGYKLEITSDDAKFKETDGVFTSTEPVSNDGTSQQTLKIKVVKTTVPIDPDSGKTELGLPNYGILFDNKDFNGSSGSSNSSGLNNSAIDSGLGLRLTSRYDSVMSFMANAYLPVSEEVKAMQYFCKEHKVYTLRDGNSTFLFSEESNDADKYILTESINYANLRLKNGDSVFVGCDYLYPKVTQITSSDYDSSDVSTFMYDDKYWKIDIITDDVGTYSFPSFGYDDSKCFYVNPETAIQPVICVMPVNPGTSDAPANFKFDYNIVCGISEDRDSWTGSYKSMELVDPKVWTFDDFKASDYKFYPDGGKNLLTYNGYASEPMTISASGTRFNLIKASAVLSDTYPDHMGHGLQYYLKKYENTSESLEYINWINDGGEYIGKFNVDDVNLGLLITADNITSKLSSGELPYLNIDLSLKEGTFEKGSIDRRNSHFISVFGTIKDGVFYMKEPHTGDWSTNFNQRAVPYSASDNFYYVDGGGVLSNEYTYTLHTHLDEGEAIFIIPDNENFSMAFDYSISTRNITKYNIDEVIEDPVGNISRVVDNNVTYKGSTEPVRLTGKPQKLKISFKNVEDVSKNDIFEEYKLTDVRYLYARLYDYDFGSIVNDGTEAEQEQELVNKQESDFKFLYNPQDNANMTVNTWHNYAYTGIVKDKLTYDGDSGAKKSIGVPQFNYSTPFGDLFTVSDETDSNGNTKKSYETKFEFAYDENTSMYSYNSLLHSASYNAERNAVLTYAASLGIDGWGMQGAGFFPFNSLDNKGEWGSAEKYNLNTWLVDKSDINYHLGMALAMNFKMPADKVMTNKDGTTSDIIYKFTGDDDVWVFVDDTLVLDMGGIHESLSGSINFTKGTYTVDGYSHNLSDIAGLDFNTDKWNENSTHSVKMYYLERGGTLSNCSMQFNIPVEEEATYHVTYDGNGSDSGDVPVDDTPYFSGDTVTVKDNESLTKNGYDFAGWAKSSDASFDDVITTFDITEDTTLYAVWKPKYKLTYDLNTGERHASGEAPSDDNYYTTGDKAVVKDGKNLKMFIEGTSGAYAEFKCWTTNPDGSGDTFTADDEVTFADKDITLYAQWEFNVVDVELPETGSSVMLIMLSAAVLLIGVGVLVWKLSGKSKSK